MNGMKEWNRFDICEAYYLFAMEYHGGQWSPEYAVFGRLSRMEFRPSPMLSRARDLTENGRMIYSDLLRRYHSGEQVVRTVR